MQARKLLKLMFGLQSLITHYRCSQQFGRPNDRDDWVRADNSGMNEQVKVDGLPDVIVNTKAQR